MPRVEFTFAGTGSFELPDTVPPIEPPVEPPIEPPVEPPVEPIPPPGEGTEITQWGVTWVFDKGYEIGQFCTGDWWIVAPLLPDGESDPVVIVDISPHSERVDGRVKNGTMLNPVPQLAGAPQGFDSGMLNHPYDDAVNAGLDVQPGKSVLAVPAGTSVVTMTSHPEAGSRPQMATCAILTVLSEAPPVGSFRPSYFGSNKEVRHKTADLDVPGQGFDLLAKLAHPANTPPMVELVAECARPRFEMYEGYTTQYCQPGALNQNASNPSAQPTYSYSKSVQMGRSHLAIHLDYTNEEKRALVNALCQIGIDYMGVDELGALTLGGRGFWGANGGHGQSRLWTIVEAGLLLGDPAMRDVRVSKADPYNEAPFAETGETYTVKPVDVGMYWNPNEVGVCHDWGHSYQSAPDRDRNASWINASTVAAPGMALQITGNTIRRSSGTWVGTVFPGDAPVLKGWGLNSGTHKVLSVTDTELVCEPTGGSPAFQDEGPVEANATVETEGVSGYRLSSTCAGWYGAALGARIMGACEYIAHPAFFHYQARYPVNQLARRTVDPQTNVCGDTNNADSFTFQFWQMHEAAFPIPDDL